jgi:hypothetical protein
MAKLRPGIEYPIIPEDFIASEEESLQLDQGLMRVCVPRNYQDGIILEDWITSEKFIFQYPET